MKKEPLQIGRKYDSRFASAGTEVDRWERSPVCGVG